VALQNAAYWLLVTSNLASQNPRLRVTRWAGLSVGNQMAWPPKGSSALILEARSSPGKSLTDRR